MEDLTILKSLSEIGVGGILGFAVYYLLRYLKTKDDIITKLIEVNSEQNSQMKDTNTFIKELSETQKQCKEYAQIGYWWSEVHRPIQDLCSVCDNYEDCPHPRKFIERRRRPADNNNLN
ncbi:MAG: hypothetical protein WC917_02465 [Bacilli bacterium]|jgi:hypothetical protein